MKKLSLKFLIFVAIYFIPVSIKAQVWDSLSTDLRAVSLYNKVHDGKLLVGIRDTVDGKFIYNIGFYD